MLSEVLKYYFPAHIRSLSDRLGPNRLLAGTLWGNPGGRGIVPGTTRQRSGGCWVGGIFSRGGILVRATPVDGNLYAHLKQRLPPCFDIELLKTQLYCFRLYR